MNPSAVGVLADDEPPVTNVVPFRQAVPPLTRAELVAVRQMIEDFRTLKHHCPTARRLIGDD